MNSITSVINNQKDQTVQYSSLKHLNNSTVKPLDILSNLSDVVHEGYEPFYVKRLEVLGYSRFMELVAKARAGSDTPQKLLSWMLKNHELVK